MLDVGHFPKIGIPIFQQNISLGVCPMELNLCRPLTLIENITFSFKI